MNSPLISVVIPNFNGAAHLENCLRSLVLQTYGRGEIIVVDNGSRDASLAVVRRVAPQARILALDRNVGFAGAVNRGIEAAHGDWIAVLNNDTEAAPDWLAECARGIERHPEAGFFACRILDFGQRDRIYSAGDCFLRFGVGYRRGQEQRDGAEYAAELPVFGACGCAALLSKSTLESAHGYDEDFFAYLEDVDLALRLQAAGARGYYLPAAAVYHVGGATSGGEFAPLAVRLRTRNAILLLLKCLPVSILARCAPFIAAGQAAWLIRVLRRHRLLSYLRGLAGVFPLMPRMLARRRSLRPLWKESGHNLWPAILESEMLARRDFRHAGPEQSRLLSWYFRKVGAEPK
jgi:GT2 family glycosyltransferase